MLYIKTKATTNRKYPLGNQKYLWWPIQFDALNDKKTAIIKFLLRLGIKYYILTSYFSACSASTSAFVARVGMTIVGIRLLQLTNLRLHKITTPIAMLLYHLVWYTIFFITFNWHCAIFASISSFLIVDAIWSCNRLNVLEIDNYWKRFVHF